MARYIKYLNEWYKLVPEFKMTVTAKAEPTQPELWDRVLRLTKGLQKSLTHNGITIEGPNNGRGFTKFPSAYASGWAVGVYKRLGGKWVTANLREWFEGHGGGMTRTASPRGDWVAIAPIKMAIDGKEYEKGDILGPCGISRMKKFKEYTNDGREPFKCMPRKKAYRLGPQERGKSAERKRREQSKHRPTKAPVKVKT